MKRYYSAYISKKNKHMKTLQRNIQAYTIYLSSNGKIEGRRLDLLEEERQRGLKTLEISLGNPIWTYSQAEMVRRVVANVR